MSPQQEWSTEVIPSFIDGLNVSERPDTLSKESLTEGNNILYDKGYIKVDTGYVTFKGVCRGNARKVYQMTYKSGSTDLILITDDTFYILAADEWQYVSDGTQTTTVGTYGEEDVDITVADATGFSVSDYVGITLTDGTQHQTTIGAIVGSVITIDDPIATGDSVASGASFVKAVDLNGTAAKHVNYTVLAANDWFVFTNGVDYPHRFDGSTVEVVPNLPSSGNTVCASVGQYKNHLLLLNTIEGGSSYPQRVRNADTGDPTNWTTGNAGFEDLYDNEDPIVGNYKLGPYQVIYRTKSIFRMEWVGAADQLFDFKAAVTDEGAISANAILDLGDYHIFAGNNNVYKYAGGFDKEKLGDNIYFHLFGIQGEITPQYKETIFMAYVRELEEVWLFYPSTGSATPNDMLRKSLIYEGWLHREFADAFVGFGFYQEDSSLKWNELVGDWQSQQWAWSSQTVLTNSPITLLCSGTQVYSYDHKAANDNGTSISYTLQTKEFVYPDFEIRVDNVTIQARGGTILIEYSNDGGNTWYEMGEVSPGGTMQPVTIYKQFVGDSVMFRITGTAGGFKMGRLEFDYILEAKN